MSGAVETPENKNVFRVQGFTCANCAGKFEQNVKQLPGVRDAKVNFGASKIVVYGDATVEQLEQAGAFENLKVMPERMAHEASQAAGTGKEENEPLYKRHSILLNAALFMVIGYVSLFVNGHDNVVTSLLFAASIVIGGFSLFTTGLKHLLRFEFDMKTLMTVAIIGAAIIGEWAEGAVVVILFAISEALERYSMDRARRSIRSLMEIAPKEALVKRNGQEVAVAVEDIAIGDMMIVKPGQKIAMDGIVMSGSSAVNQAAITGESVPVDKTVGDEVFAGTLNEEGLLEVKVTKLVEDTTLAKIIHLVEEAQGERAPSQNVVDTFAKYYTPAIMGVAALVALIPPLLFEGDWTSWIYQGLSVLVVGCPCALVISTPISIVSAIGNAAKHGVLIKGGVYLEEIGTIRAVAFDKTGTLTEGTPKVTDVNILGGSMNVNELLSVAAALENRSQHPLASAIVRKAEQEHISYKNVTVEQFLSVTGKGIKGTVGGTTYLIGSPMWVGQLASSGGTQEVEQAVQQFQSQGKTVMAVGTEREIMAVIAVADDVRETSKETIRKLHQLGIRKTVMLTGDNRSTAESIARQVGVTDVRAELMPEDKLEAVKGLRSDYGKVAMVGDGVNDAPALAASTVGVAMGASGTDTALETADVALMGDDLRKLPFSIVLGRKTVRVIQQNIVFALLVKFAALLLVVPGWLTLWIAIVADMGATILVALNGMRLMRVKD